MHARSTNTIGGISSCFFGIFFFSLLHLPIFHRLPVTPLPLLFLYESLPFVIFIACLSRFCRHGCSCARSTATLLLLYHMVSYIRTCAQYDCDRLDFFVLHPASGHKFFFRFVPEASVGRIDQFPKQRGLGKNECDPQFLPFFQPLILFL